MGDDYDGLEQAAGGDVRATAELMGMTFELLSFEEVETRYKDEKLGKNRVTQIATLILEGEEEQLRYWLGGVQVNRQLAYLKTTGRLPLVMKLGGEGNQDSPYKLVPPDDETPLVEAGKAAGAKVVGRKGIDALAAFRDKEGALDTKGFGRFWQDQGHGLDELRDIIGPLTASSVEHWFKVNKGKQLDSLLDLAQANREKSTEDDMDAGAEDPFSEELPFE